MPRRKKPPLGNEPYPEDKKKLTPPNEDGYDTPGDMGDDEDEGDPVLVKREPKQKPKPRGRK